MKKLLSLKVSCFDILFRSRVFLVFSRRKLFSKVKLWLSSSIYLHIEFWYFNLQVISATPHSSSSIHELEIDWGFRKIATTIQEGRISSPSTFFLRNRTSLMIILLSSKKDGGMSWFWQIVLRVLYLTELTKVRHL